MKDKSNIPRDLKAKISRNCCNKVKKDWDKFGYKIIKNSREALLLDMKNGNTLWDDVIAKDMKAPDRLGVFQF